MAELEECYKTRTLSLKNIIKVIVFLLLKKGIYLEYSYIYFLITLKSSLKMSIFSKSGSRSGSGFIALFHAIILVFYSKQNCEI